MANNNGKKATHDDMIKRAAQIRAWITAFLNANKTQDFTMAMIWDALKDKFESVHYNDVALRAMLTSMANNNLILSQKEGNQLHFMSIDSPARVTKTANGQAAEKSKATHFSIDIVKSSGKVRITAGDIVIDVGIVNK